MKRLLATVLALVAVVAVAAVVKTRRDLRDANERIDTLERRPEDGQDDDDPPPDSSGRIEGQPGDRGRIGGFDPDVVGCIAGGGSARLFGASSGTRDRVGMRAVARRVAKIRNLDFKHVPEARFLGAAPARRRIAELFRRDYGAEEARADGLILGALGAIPAGTDLRAEIERLLTSQVAGFYVPQTGELVVKRSAEGLGPPGEITLAHELQHALADQVFDLPIDEDGAAGEEDAALATLSVIEGDATLTMQRYAIQHLSLTDQFAMALDLGMAAALTKFRAAPHFLQQQLTFPYVEGLSFVCDLYSRGGWKAVDRAYRHPPETSAEVLFPERYPSGEEGVDPRDPEPPPGWSKRAVRAFGAAPLSWLLDAPAGRSGAAPGNADEAAAEWAGGEARLFERAGRFAVSLALVDRPGGGGLCHLILDWYGAAFPGASKSREGDTAMFEAEQDAALTCRDGEVRLGIGPSLEVARALAR